MRSDDRCPVTVLTGFLGAGKTSLLNSLIRGREDLRFAVIVNEFGELGIDGALIEASDDDVIQLSNGCLCCSVRGDLMMACDRLARRRHQFDWLIIETSGLADPAPIAQSFLLSDGPSETFRLDGVVALVDAVNFSRQHPVSEVAGRQITFADKLILRKTDLVTPKDCEKLIEHLRLYNAAADVVFSSPEIPALEALTGLHAYDLSNIPSHLCFLPAPKHDASIGSESFRFERPFDFTSFSSFIKRLLISRDDILRVKGIIDLAGEDRLFAFHGVQSLIDGDVIGPWGDQPRHSNLVFIGRNLHRPQLESALVACLA